MAKTSQQWRYSYDRIPDLAGCNRIIRGMLIDMAELEEQLRIAYWTLGFGDGREETNGPDQPTVG